MKKIAVTLCCLVLFLSIYAQETSLDGLLQEGLSLHDKGDYAGAIAKYDEILQRDDRFYMAYVEKSLTLYMSGKYEDCADLCKKAIKKFPDSAENRNIYVNYGSALDVLGKSDQALKVYSEGIKRFPGFYLLPFNKGVTEYRLKKYDDAVVDLERSVSLKPMHASSHQFLAYSIYPTNRVAAGMALTTFLVLEPQGDRAERNLKILQGILVSNVQKKDDKTINIFMSAASLDTKTRKEDDFRTTELTLTFSSANDMSKSSDSLSPMKKLEEKLNFFAIANSEKKGFFSHYYIPYLAALKENHFLETAACLIYQTTNDERDRAWLNANKDKVDALAKFTEDHLGQ